MVNAVNTTYQPSVAYQGGGAVTQRQQAPSEGQTQPKHAPAADTQRAEHKTEPAPRETRGTKVDIKA